MASKSEEEEFIKDSIKSGHRSTVEVMNTLVLAELLDKPIKDVERVVVEKAALVQDVWRNL